MMKLIPVSRSTYDRSQYLLQLERQITQGLHDLINDKDRELSGLRLELEQIKVALDHCDARRESSEKGRSTALASLDSLQSTYDSALAASAEVAAERDRALEREREANQRAHNAATVLRGVEAKLIASEHSLDLCRSRREQMSMDLGALRSAAMDLCSDASCVIRFILAHSSGGSLADAEATRLRKACEGVESLLNT